MKKALARFLLPVSIILLILAAWITFESRLIMFNPDAKAVSNISDSAIIIYIDQGDVCFFMDEQTGKVRARIATSLPVPLSTSPLYQSAKCKTNSSEVTCSTQAVLRVKKEPIYFEPWLAKAGVQAVTGPISLQEGTFDVYIGENYKGRMIVRVGNNLPGLWCKSPLGTLEFTILPTPTFIQPEKQKGTPTVQ